MAALRCSTIPTGSDVSVVYRYGPGAKKRFRTLSPGAALAVMLWAVASVHVSISMPDGAAARLLQHTLAHPYVRCAESIPSPLIDH
jgi:hypothetical protein